jgi:RNA polymerase sigma-70 factor (ECF subfamily)
VGRLDSDALIGQAMADGKVATAPGIADAVDAAFARRLAQREPAACAELYDRFAPGIHRFAVTRLAGDVQSAEDLVVETLADAVRDVGRFNPRRASLSAWLYGIARRRVHLERRRRRRRKSVPAAAQVPLEAVSEVAAGGDLAAGVAARLDAQRQVARLAGLLLDVEMEALALSCVERLSVKEIGQIMGRSERAVHSLLHRARQKAREGLVGDEQ